MAELIKIIDEAGVAIVINLDYVVQMQPTERENMTAITMALKRQPISRLAS